MRFATARVRAHDSGARGVAVRGARGAAVRFPALVAAAALVAVAVAACGSSSKPTITKAEYVQKANAICVQGNAKQRAAVASLGEHPSEAQVKAFMTSTLVPNIQAQIDQVRALGAPSGEAATVSHMLALAQEDLDKTKSNPAVFTSESSHPFANFAAVAHPYGLTACAVKE
ncbi:MAG TPA: hypothetical protein VEJ23_10285 [Solirubrobacteraceae bacterium]|nr:hypothetical protein [Solirubrobacteraceae bacterium]